MASSVPSTDDFIESFPIQPTKLIDQPDYSSLTTLRNEFKQNAASIPSNRGGGAHGYLGLTLSAALYDSLVPCKPFTIPPTPEPNPSSPLQPPQPRSAHYSVATPNKCVNGVSTPTSTML
jgi:hypothetical protein